MVCIDIKDWTFCRKLLKPYGGTEGFLPSGKSFKDKRGLRRRVESIKPSEVPPEIAAMAEEILAPYTVDQI